MLFLTQERREIVRNLACVDCISGNCHYTTSTGYPVTGGDMVSTWVAKLRVHAEAQITS